ncbi:uncharacterized protein METZ01_LOCUS499711, partial [marine metagenome]
MFCRNCGKDQPDSVESCGLCGHPTGVSKKTSSLPYAQEPNQPSYTPQPVPEYSPTPYIPPPEPAYNTTPYNSSYREASHGQQMDDGLALLLYIISFLLPLAGFIIGAIYVSKDEEHYRQV